MKITNRRNPWRLAGLVGAAVFLLAACGGDMTLVAATRSNVVGTWLGTDGTRISLVADGKFSVAHWPSGTPSGNHYASYQGTWRLADIDDGVQRVLLNISDEPANDYPPLYVDGVSTRDGFGLCINTDPDELCPLGLLSRQASR